MTAEEGGRFHAVRQNVPDGQRRYTYLRRREDRPDPCSLWQPDNILGPSAVYRPGRFRRTDGD